MQTLDIIQRAGANLKQSKGRTFLTSLAIAVGACTITLAMAAGAGGRDYVSKQLIDRGIGQTDSINIYPAQDEDLAKDEYNVEPYIEEGAKTGESESAGPPKEFTADKIAEIRKVEGVADVRYSYEITGLFVNRFGSQDRFVAPYLSVQNTISPLSLTAGTFEEDLLPGQAIISEDYVQAFGFDSPDQALNQKFQLTYLDLQNQRITQDLIIRGVFKNPEDTSNFIFSYSDAQVIAEHQLGPIEQQSYHQVTAIVDDSADTEKVVQDIVNLGYSAISNRQMQANFLDSINIVQWGLVGFGALALLASIFGIINTQYISVLERTQQIGLMRAVGASRSDIGRLFRYEAAWIGLLGASIGIIVALACKLAEPIVKNVLQMPNDFTILIFEPLTLVAIVAILVFVAVAAGFFPARRAAKLDPIEALRTE